MLRLKPHPASSADRVAMSADVADLNELRDLHSPSKHFVLFLAADTRDQEGPELVGIAEALIRNGASYVCCWGPGCERFHDCFDEADLYVNDVSSDERIVMTTWHDDESLEEALWFAMTAAWPAQAYEATTNAVVALAVNSPEWSERITKYLDAGVPLRDDA
jgi:hypothetical protein